MKLCWRASNRSVVVTRHDELTNRFQQYEDHGAVHLIAPQGRVK